MLERCVPEGDDRALHLAKGNRAEDRPLDRAEEVGEEEVEAVQRHEAEREPSVSHGDVDSEAS